MASGTFKVNSTPSRHTYLAVQILERAKSTAIAVKPGMTGASDENKRSMLNMFVTNSMLQLLQ